MIKCLIKRKTQIKLRYLARPQPSKSSLSASCHPFGGAGEMHYCMDNWHQKIKDVYEQRRRCSRRTLKCNLLIQNQEKPSKTMKSSNVTSLGLQQRSKSVQMHFSTSLFLSFLKTNFLVRTWLGRVEETPNTSKRCYQCIIYRIARSFFHSQLFWSLFFLYWW